MGQLRGELRGGGGLVGHWQRLRDAGAVPETAFTTPGTSDIYIYVYICLSLSLTHSLSLSLSFSLSLSLFLRVTLLG